MKGLDKIKVTLSNNITIHVKNGKRSVSINKPKRLVKVESYTDQKIEIDK
jgi:hypothetical protein